MICMSHRIVSDDLHQKPSVSPLICSVHILDNLKRWNHRVQDLSLIVSHSPWLCSFYVRKPDTGYDLEYDKKERLA